MRIILCDKENGCLIDAVNINVRIMLCDKENGCLIDAVNIYNCIYNTCCNNVV